MKRPKLKKASKRLSCSKRYKIQKKVREHNRKLKKEAKKKGVGKRPKKDPGVPSSAPFKEEVLREAEQRRLQIEEEKEKKRQIVKDERAKKRKKEKDAKENEPDNKKARREKNKTDKRTGLDKSSKKFLCGELNKAIDSSDVVLEVLDARDPLGSRCPQLEEAVLQRGGNKKLLLVLNKIDLVPKANVEKWLKCLYKEFPVVLFKASTQIQHKTVHAKKTASSNEIMELSRATTCLGKTCLVQLLSTYAEKTKGEGVALRVGVAGFPNVGKSSLINSLKGVLACHAGVTRGITKCVQEVHISRTVKLIDTPGIVASPSNPAVSMTLRSLRVEQGEESGLEATGALLNECDKSQIMLQFNLPDYRDPLEFLTSFAKRRGFLQKGGIPNTGQAAAAFLSDWTGPKMSYHCEAEENGSLPTYLSDAAVAEMKSAWDLSAAEAGNAQTLKAVKCPNPASSVSFTSKGPTVGVLDVGELTEEKPAAAPSHENDEEEPEQTPTQEEATQEDELEEATQEEPVAEKPSKVHFPVDVNLTATPTDDAYDFNTDFK